MLNTPAPIFLEDILADIDPGSDTQIECAGRRAQRQPLSYGWVRESATQPGITAAASDYVALEDYAIAGTGEPELLLLVNFGDPLAGITSGNHWELATHGVCAVNVHDQFETKNLRRTQQHLTRCGISIDPSWLNSGRLDELELSTPQVRKVLGSHLKRWHAAAPPTLMSTAQRLSAALNAEGPEGQLEREAATLQFLIGTLSFFSAEDTASQARTSERDRKRMLLVRDVLDGLGPFDEISFTGLAGLVGMSIRSLARHFHSVFGMTVSAYVSNSRMTKAHRALERGEATVDLAAYIAGYSHPANFTRAFRRRYGCTPSSKIPSRKDGAGT